jgi:hypothetical protein
MSFEKLSWFTGKWKSVTSGLTQCEGIVHGDFAASCGLKLSVPFFADYLAETCQAIRRCEITDGAVEPNTAVMIDILSDTFVGFIPGCRATRFARASGRTGVRIP